MVEAASAKMFSLLGRGVFIAKSVVMTGEGLMAESVIMTESVVMAEEGLMAESVWMVESVVVAKWVLAAESVVMAELASSEDSVPWMDLSVMLDGLK